MELVLIIIVIIFLVAGFQLFNQSTRRKTLSTAIKEIPDFSASKEIMGKDGFSGIAVDVSRKKICLIKLDGINTKHRVIDYHNIVSSEIIEDGTSVTKTSRTSQVGGAIIGGLAFGGVGALVGGLTGAKKTSDKVNNIDLQIIVNDPLDPLHKINFLNLPTGKHSILYKEAIDKAKNWHATVEILIKQADQELEINGKQ